mgnify:CR=1 FL=1|jgi:hypothetical protein|tara:strand:- start:49 stop:588 length:540 start_codon:yes stop_codon:yes gene_type:complete
MDHVFVHTPQYVCFTQDTGEIYSIGPSIEEGYQYIEVTENQIAPIKSLKEKMTDYVVLYNRTEKQFLLRKIVIDEHLLQFKQVKKYDTNMYDILLVIDKASKICYTNTNTDLIDVMKKTKVDLTKEVTFSITKKDDPHFLYSVIKFTIGEDISHPFYIDDDYSVYTSNEMAECVYKEKV